MLKDSLQSENKHRKEEVGEEEEQVQYAVNAHMTSTCCMGGASSVD